MGQALHYSGSTLPRGSQGTTKNPAQIRKAPNPHARRVRLGAIDCGVAGAAAAPPFPARRPAAGPAAPAASHGAAQRRWAGLRGVAPRRTRSSGDHASSLEAAAMRVSTTRAAAGHAARRMTWCRLHAGGAGAAAAAFALSLPSRVPREPGSAPSGRWRRRRGPCVRPLLARARLGDGVLYGTALGQAGCCDATERDQCGVSRQRTHAQEAHLCEKIGCNVAVTIACAFHAIFFG